MDGNLAALRIFQSQNDEADQYHDLFGQQVLSDLIDDLMRGESVYEVRGVKVNLSYVLDYVLDGLPALSYDDTARLVKASREEVIEFKEEIDERARQHIIAFLGQDLGADIVEERARELMNETE